MEKKKAIVREMSDNELIAWFKGLHESIVRFGSKDLNLEQILIQEIKRRGYQITPIGEVH